MIGTFPARATDADSPFLPSENSEGGILAAAPSGTSTLPTFLSQDTMTGNWGGLRKKLANEGVTITPAFIGEVFGNPSGGRRQGVIADGAVSVALEFDIGKMSGGAVTDLIFHANAVYTYGTSLSQAFVGDFSNTSSIAFYNSLRLQELWLEKGFWDKRLSIRAGNMSVDSEFFQSVSANLFLNGTFGALNSVVLNAPNFPSYPLASPGVRLEFLPTPQTYFMAGVYGMDNDSCCDTNNRFGTRFAMAPDSGMLVMSEIGYLLNQESKDHGLQGTYRLGSFVDTGNFTTWSSYSDQTFDSGSPQKAGADYGIYGVVDQQLYVRESESISGFVHAGGAPPNSNFIDAYVDGGFDFTGFMPGRPNDVAGIAVTRSHVSRDFSNSQVAQGNAPFTAETVIEATYKIQLAPWWSVQPDLQYIITPGGENGAANATAIGLRTSIGF